MEPLTLALSLALGALTVDAILELAFITNMVSWLHTRAGGSFTFSYASSDGNNNFTITPLALHGKPLHLLLNQGHTSNGAAGTALVVVGLGGFLALFLRHWTASARRSNNSFANRPVVKRVALLWYHAWLALTVFSTLLTLAALIYTFVLTHQSAGQAIDLAVVATLAAQAAGVVPGAPVNGVVYPLDDWTPETWFQAVLRLPGLRAGDVDDIQSELRLMVGWRWNLVPLFILGVGVCVLAGLDAVRRRARAREGKEWEQEKLSG